MVTPSCAHLHVHGAQANPTRPASGAADPQPVLPNRCPGPASGSRGSTLQPVYSNALSLRHISANSRIRPTHSNPLRRRGGHGYGIASRRGDDVDVMGGGGQTARLKAGMYGTLEACSYGPPDGGLWHRAWHVADSFVLSSVRLGRTTTLPTSGHNHQACAWPVPDSHLLSSIRLSWAGTCILRASTSVRRQRQRHWACGGWNSRRRGRSRYGGMAGQGTGVGKRERARGACT